MVKEITKFKGYLYFLSLEQKLYGIDTFIDGLLIEEHPCKNVKQKYRTLEELKLTKLQLLTK